MGYSMETMLILHYKDDAAKTHCLPVRWRLLRELAEGKIECCALEAKVVTALVQNRYLEPLEDAFAFTDRLYWQAGVARS